MESRTILERKVVVGRPHAATDADVNTGPLICVYGTGAAEKSGRHSRKALRSHGHPPPRTHAHCLRNNHSRMQI